MCVCAKLAGAMQSSQRRRAAAGSTGEPVGQRLFHLAAKAAGEFGYGAQWAGQGAPLARALPATELVARLRSEMEQALADRLPG